MRLARKWSMLRIGLTGQTDRSVANCKNISSPWHCVCVLDISVHLG